MIYYNDRYMKNNCVFMSVVIEYKNFIINYAPNSKLNTIC